MARTALALLVACAGGAPALIAPVHAESTTRIVVSFPPGGPVDIVARTLAEQLGKELGTRVIVENKAGANGAIGADAVARSEPDGSTLWITSVGAAAINPSLYPKLPYDMERDFVPVSLVVNNVEVMVVRPDRSPADVKAMLAAAISSGKPLTLASSGIGSIPHFVMEQLADASKAPITHVPYKGAAPAITDVMGGQVDAFFGDVPGLIGHIRGKRLLPVALAADKRHPLLPDVPTLGELGLPGIDSDNWYALFVPAKTDPAVVAKLNAAVRRSIADPAVNAKLAATGAEPKSSTQQELGALVARDTEKWRRIIESKRITAQ